MPTADLHHMRAALSLARRGLGRVWPNPAVGCVLVKDGTVVGRGWTQPGGRPHAETEALARAGAAATGATAYVTLEPCAHHGKTPPCADALIAAGVGRVVVALEDPDPRVSGGGIQRMIDAGITVDVGLCGAEAAEINAGFFLKVRASRPLVTLKTASTLDGRIATHRGESQWITGEAARRASHLLRAQHDAVVVGSGTALADNPDLTCRLDGLQQWSPVRVVFDSHLRLPLTAKLVATAREVPTWMVALDNADHDRRAALIDCGVEIISVHPGEGGNPDIGAALHELGKRGLTRVLVEGGAHLAAALLRRHLVDRIAWFRAPKLIGGDGLPVAMPFSIDHLADAPTFKRLSLGEIGGDAVEMYGRE
jgi:diaminohydroxyphosphoribosylaminopyrimidine deaminase/5-amino-6-(5-phosphoribosylamino)uracil reductase